MAWNLKGKIAKCSHREYGYAAVKIKKVHEGDSPVDALFRGLGEEMQASLKCDFMSQFGINGRLLGSNFRRYRYGCRTGISCPKSPLVSMLSDIQTLRHLLQLRTIPSHSTESNFIRRLLTPREERKSSEGLFWIYVVAKTFGLWCVWGFSTPEVFGH